jgi:hypothetical protein
VLLSTLVLLPPRWQQRVQKIKVPKCLCIHPNIQNKDKNSVDQSDYHFLVLHLMTFVFSTTSLSLLLRVVLVHQCQLPFKNNIAPQDITNTPIIYPHSKPRAFLFIQQTWCNPATGCAANHAPTNTKHASGHRAPHAIPASFTAMFALRDDYLLGKGQQRIHPNILA